MNNNTITSLNTKSNSEKRNAKSEKINHFTQLEVWQIAKTLTIDIYQCTKNFPSEEKFGLTNQLRRASVSIVSNIAEGFGRKSPLDKARFYTIARGSTDEVECQFLISKELNFLKESECHKAVQLCIRVKKMLNSLNYVLEKSTRNAKCDSRNAF